MHVSVSVTANGLQQEPKQPLVHIAMPSPASSQGNGEPDAGHCCTSYGPRDYSHLQPQAQFLRGTSCPQLDPASVGLHGSYTDLRWVPAQPRCTRRSQRTRNWTEPSRGCCSSTQKHCLARMSRVEVHSPEGIVPAPTVLMLGESRPTDISGYADWSLPAYRAIQPA